MPSFFVAVSEIELPKEATDPLPLLKTAVFRKHDRGAEPFPSLQECCAEVPIASQGRQRAVMLQRIQKSIYKESITDL